MDRNDAESIYDALCRALTDYEGNGTEGLSNDAGALYEAVSNAVQDMSGLLWRCE